MSDKLLSPKSDIVFKLIFGDRKNTDILAGFLQSILDLPPEEYETITVTDPHLNPQNPGNKTAVLDIKVATKNGKQVDIEIQLLPVKAMKERIVFYTAGMLTGQLGKGEGYDQLKKVISIVITDFVLIQDSTCYHNRYNLYDERTLSAFCDIIELHTVELPKVSEENDGSALWLWARFFKTNKREEFDMLAEQNGTIKKTVGILKELSSEERERLLEESNLKFMRDWTARIHDAFEDGVAKGQAEGLEKGVMQEKHETARKLKSLGLSLEQIAEFTGLLTEDIEKL